MPADARGGIQVLRKPSVAQSRLVDHVPEAGGRLVVHAPPAVDEYQAALRDELLHGAAARRALRAPPPREEGNLGVGEALGGVGQEVVHHGVQDVLHAGELDGGVGA